jgi:hypothetical protein
MALLARRCFSQVEEHKMPSLIPPQYNEFLFALIGEQDNETPLSVLSALTRLDIDPWEEAARLTELPKQQAIQEMGSALRALPCGTCAAAEPNKIAALVELLPRNRTSAKADRIGFQIVLPLVLMFLIFGAVFAAILVEDFRAAANHRVDQQVANIIPWQLSLSRSDANFSNLPQPSPGAH